MDLKERTGQGLSVTEQVARLQPDEFLKWAEGGLDLVRKMLDVLATGVEERQISTYQAAGVLACITGQLFGYQEFHGSIPGAVQRMDMGERSPQNAAQ